MKKSEIPPSKIWNKLSSKEKREWKKHYKSILWEIKQIAHGENIEINKITMEVISHNLAFKLIWGDFEVKK